MYVGDDGDEKVGRVREGVMDITDLDLLPLCVELYKCISFCINN